MLLDSEDPKKVMVRGCDFLNNEKQMIAAIPGPHMYDQVLKKLGAVHSAQLVGFMSRHQKKGHEIAQARV